MSRGVFLAVMVVTWSLAACGGGGRSDPPASGVGGLGNIGGTGAPGGVGGGDPPAPVCGDGALDTGEDCDDGNTTPGDGCAANCRAVCGDGIKQGAESCDDANDVVGDGCTRCLTPGALAWRVTPSCVGPLVRGRDDTIIVLCEADGGTNTTLFERYTLGGALVEAYPNLIADAAEGEVMPQAIAETAAGDVYVAIQVRRNIVSGSAGNWVRTRVVKIDAARNVVWTANPTPFPTVTRQEYPYAIAVNGAGQVAVAGLSHRDPTDNRAFAVLLSDAGVVSWTFTTAESATATAVILDDAGSVYFAAGVQYSLAVNDFVYNGAWALTPAGQLRWSWVDRPAGAADEGAGATDIMFGGADTVRVLGRNILVDELVPNPPRSTTSNWVRDLSAASGSPLSDPLSVYASSADGMEPEEVEALQPVPAFARAPNALASAYNGTMAFGVGPAGQMLWSATAQFRKGWVWGTLTHDHLWCIAENSPALQVRCFLTR